jgi:hypothetical protein
MPTPPPFAKGEWLAWKQNDGNVYHDASKAFQFVGSKNDEHAHLLDLTFGTLNVGMMVPEDLIALPLALQVDGNNVNVLREPQKIARLKETTSARLMGNKELITRIETARRELTKMFPAETENGFGDFFVVVDNAIISQVVQKRRNQRGEEELRHFKMDGNNITSYQEFELYSKSPLEVKDGKFWLEDKQFVPRGYVMDSLSSSRILDRTRTKQIVDTANEDVDWAKRLGGNFIHLFINIGQEHVESQNYRDAILGVLANAKNKGMRITVTPRTMGRHPSGLWEGDADKIDFLHVDEYKRNFRRLLSDEQFADRFIGLVDIFNPLGEPAYNMEGLPHKNKPLIDRVPFRLSWEQSKLFCDEVFKILNDKFPMNKILRAYSPPFWGTDVRQLIQKLPTGDGWALEWHPYQGAMSGLQNQSLAWQLEEIKNKKICAYAGELGWIDPPHYTNGVLDRLATQGIGYAYYVMNTDGTQEFKAVAGSSLVTKAPTQKGYLTIYYNRKK